MKIRYNIELYLKNLNAKINYIERKTKSALELMDDNTNNEHDKRLQIKDALKRAIEELEKI
jgi:hypothetical protein